MLRIGLTGGIGSGKSVAAGCFSRLGIDTVDTDKLARELVQPGQSSYQSIVDKFGVGILKKSGQINRAKLREQVFTHPEDRQWLEQLLHPKIRQKTLERIEAIKSPYCIVAIPLLIETNSKDVIDRILVIDVPEALQVQRVMARDSMTVEQAQAIIKAQVNRRERLSWADDVIVNEGSMDQLKQQIEALHQQYLKKVRGLG